MLSLVVSYVLGRNVVVQGRLIGCLKVVPRILSSSTVLMFDRHPSIATSLVPSVLPLVFPPNPSIRPVHFLFQSLRLLDTLACLLLVVSFVPTRPERRRYSRNYTLFLAKLEVFFLDGLPNTRTRRKTGRALLRMGDVDLVELEGR